MSSITTAIPTGAMPLGTPWCMSPLLNPLVMQKPHPFSECANSSAIPPTVPSDFQTICCDGVIIDTTFDIWGEAMAWFDNIRMNATATWPLAHHRLNLDNLVCCREAGATQWPEVHDYVYFHGGGGEVDFFVSWDNGGEDGDDVVRRLLYGVSGRFGGDVTLVQES
ncbi:hypothetical protein B0T18DRAFT_385757 [Schizothecium vesticola]|uniref:Uncharacterized protein n=1 Tax=Schizothecium vesticola TaxID=314040 RepID=A0AA40KCG5_9PEZI|nr:hypothetical protein B0T18DRAFT_385757 [Schizothecium vesticola]